jgi:hypothetical protein
MAANKVENSIVVRTKVCRHTDGTCMTGMLTAITTKTKGKQKLSQSLYNIQFLDNEKLRCGLETVKDMHASYASCRAKFAQKTPGGTKAPQSLYPEGLICIRRGCLK